MSEPKIISPLLDNFMAGGAMSEHHGIRCYPAIENETGDRYIVKVISVPATPSQLDALLLTGAFPDKASAISYFADMANCTLDEVATLEKLTELEGFTAYTAHQMVPAESGEGFEVHLLGTYKRALDKHFQRSIFTHLDALNLGIDLCSALSVCRRLGYMYIDLKPGNIFINDQKQFQIGDLGFVRLDSLKYTSIPEKYISTYTPPEISDAFSELNTTVDVYAAGLILYQAYNNGELPFNAEVQPGDALPAPLYADYEMSEIILKACAANPEDRWQEPTQMGQAIISYMQRNGAADTPIVPMAVATPDPDEVEISTENSEEEAITADDTPIEETDAELQETVSNEAAQIVTDTESIETEESDEADEPILSDEFSDTDDTTLEDIATEASLTEEVSDMLDQADELASMTVPEPVVVPDYVEVTMPEEVAQEPQAEVAPDNEDDDSPEEDSEEATAYDEDDDYEEDIVPPVKKKRWFGKVILVLLLAALLVGGYFFYKEYYLVPIEIRSVEGSLNTLTIRISADVDESKLSVVCSGDYGIKFTAPVVDGEAKFTKLIPNTGYTVEIQVNGFHRLVGNTTTTYSTPAQTNILQFDAITGDTDDSAILTFTVEGPSCDKWSVAYSADGEQEQTALFTEHMATLSNLTVGKEYTFRLVPSVDLYLTGQHTITFKPQPIVIAKKLQATSCVNNKLSVTWESPDSAVASWSVQCYNDTYNQTIITTETNAIFTDLDHTAGYTIEVKAAGMSKGTSVVVPANSVTAENFQINTSDPTKLNITWGTAQEIPEDGWKLHYSIVGTNKEETITCKTNTAVITPVVPKATYKIWLEDTNGNTLLNSERTITTGESVSFTKNFGSYTAQASDLEFTMCKTPDVQHWGTYDLSAEDYRSTFTVGESGSFLVKFEAVRRKPDEDVTIMYVTRNQNGGIIHTGTQSNNWADMWTTTYSKLTIPVTPGTPGEYTVDIYFDGMLVHKQAFTIKQ